jgi:exonuclease VII small subunit
MSEGLIELRESLEDAYNKLRRAMAYAKNEGVYATLDEARKLLIDAIQLVNQAIDAEDAPFEVVEG